MPERRMTQAGNTLMPMLLAALMLAAGCCAPVRAEENPSRGPEPEARRLVEDVLHGAGNAHATEPDADAARLAGEIMDGAGGVGGDVLGEWSRGIVERALERAGESARTAAPGPESGTGPGTDGPPASPLPAERHARSLAGNAGGRASTAEVLVLLSLSVPAASWRQWAHDAARAGVPLVLRGVGEGGLPGTARRIGDRLGGAGVGVAIDPRLFRLFGIDRVPVVVIVPGGVPPCRSRGCAEDPAPPHDLIAGNVGLVAALQAVADEGAVGGEVARRHLERMERTQ